MTGEKLMVKNVKDREKKNHIDKKTYQSINI